MTHAKQFFLFLLGTCSFCFTQAQGTIAVSKTDSAHLPKNIKYAGNLKEAIRWTDSLGTHYIIAAESGIYQNPVFKHESDGLDAEVFACHYIAGKDSLSLVW